MLLKMQQKKKKEKSHKPQTPKLKLLEYHGFLSLPVRTSLPHHTHSAEFTSNIEILGRILKHICST